MTLDEAFASKDTVAGDVKRQLTDRLLENGYEIVASLVTDIEPDARVKASMNDINASMRQVSSISGSNSGSIVVVIVVA